MNFISETQLEEIKQTVGERVEDGTVTVDKPLFEILKEQKEKKEAEEKAKFRNLPPKGLDEEEMEFLDTLDKHRKEQEREKALEEEEALTQFHTAILSRTVKVQETSDQHHTSDAAGVGTKRKQDQIKSKSMFAPKFKVGVQVQAKKTKGTLSAAQSKPTTSRVQKADLALNASGEGTEKNEPEVPREKEDGSREQVESARKGASTDGVSGIGVASKSSDSVHQGVLQTGLGGLVAYGDDSDDEDDEKD